MKTNLFFLLISFLMIISSCSNDEKLFTGYIAENQKPVIYYEEGKGPNPIQAEIKVVVENDTITAKFNDRAGFNGYYLVRFPDTYPPAIGKKVCVEGYISEEKLYWINSAWIE